MIRALAALVIGSTFILAPSAGAAQLEQMGMDSAPAAVAAPVGIIDTAFNPSPFQGVRVSGPVASGYADHGTWMTSAIVDADLGTAPGAAVHAFSCELQGGIDIECAGSAVEALLDEGSVRVISMSFVYAGTVPPAVTQRWSALAARAASQGVLLIASSKPGASFPADVGGIISVATLETGGADVLAPGIGVITEASCHCESEVHGVSYSSAWIAGAAARLLGEGASVDSVRASLTAGQAFDYLAARSAAGLAPIVETTTVVAKPRPVILRNGRAVLRNGRLTVTWQGNAKRYQVAAGARRSVTGRTRAVFAFRAGKAPRSVLVRAQGRTLRILVRR